MKVIHLSGRPRTSSNFLASIQLDGQDVWSLHFRHRVHHYRRPVSLQQASWHFLADVEKACNSPMCEEIL